MEKVREPSITQQNNENARVRFGALLPYIFKKHPRYNLPTESFRHGREKTSGRAFRILSFLSSLSQRIKIEPTKLCTTLSKHGALYPRAVGMPYRVFITNLRVGCGHSISFCLHLCLFDQRIQHIPPTRTRSRSPCIFQKPPTAAATYFCRHCRK